MKDLTTNQILVVRTQTCLVLKGQMGLELQVYEKFSLGLLVDEYVELC